MLGFLRRNLRVNNRDTMAAAYKTLVRPNLEYCATVWSPYTDAGILKIEMVQRRAARYATSRYHNTSSVTDMLQNLDWETLESRRVKLQLTLLYKIIHDLVDIPGSTILHLRVPVHGQEQITQRSSDRYQRQQMSTKTVSSLKSSQFGTLCRPLWPRPPTWYPSSRGCPALHCKLG